MMFIRVFRTRFDGLLIVHVVTPLGRDVLIAKSAENHEANVQLALRTLASHRTE